MCGINKFNLCPCSIVATGSPINEIEASEIVTEDATEIGDGASSDALVVSNFAVEVLQERLQRKIAVEVQSVDVDYELHAGQSGTSLSYRRATIDNDPVVIK